MTRQECLQEGGEKEAMIQMAVKKSWWYPQGYERSLMRYTQSGGREILLSGQRDTHLLVSPYISVEIS